MNKIIHIPTDKPTKVGICIKEMSDVKIGTIQYFPSPLFMSLDYWQPQHLYELSDDEINLGDWYYTKDSTTEYSAIHQAITERIVQLCAELNNSLQKIIGTTNNGLGLPIIMDDEIQQYCGITKTEYTYTESEVKNLLRKYKNDVYAYLKIFTTGQRSPFHQDWLDKNLKK